MFCGDKKMVQRTPLQAIGPAHNNIINDNNKNNNKSNKNKSINSIAIQLGRQHGQQLRGIISFTSRGSEKSIPN